MAAMEILIPIIIITALISRVTTGRTAATATAVIMAGGSSFNGNGGYNGGYSNSGRQPGRRLSKSTTNKMVCGVCAGIAEYFNWDPTIIRIIWIAASIFLGAGFLGLIAYFIVAVIMPEG